VRLDPALDQVISPDTKVEKLAGGFGFVEGPVRDTIAKARFSST
jgi:hypothetical protein